MEELLPGLGFAALVIIAVMIFTFGQLALAIIGSIIDWIKNLFK